MFNKRVKNIIRNHMVSEGSQKLTQVHEPDWNGLLVEHLTETRRKRERRMRVTKVTVTATLVLVLTFVFMVILTSLNDIRAGNFNFFDAIRDLGRTIEINEINEIYSESNGSDMSEKRFSQYTDYNEFMLAHPIKVSYKGDYSEIGYEVISIHLSETYAGDTLVTYYKNITMNDMFSISGFIKNPKVDSSTHTVYPNSEHTVREVDGITVDFYEADFGNFAVFTKDGIDFTMEYYKLPEEHVDMIISGLRIYGS